MHNLVLNEFQTEPIKLYMGKYYKRNTITIPIENELIIKGGDPINGKYFYSHSFEKGDSIIITYNHIKIDEGKNVIYPIFDISNRESNFNEMNFDFLLYKKNVETKAFPPKYYGLIKSIEMNYEKNNENAKFILDSLTSIKAISSDFRHTKEIYIGINRLRNDLYKARIRKGKININELEISINDDEQHLNEHYLSYLNEVIRYEYFNARKQFPKSSELYDFIPDNETFLSDKLRMALLKKYLKTIYTAEPLRFNDYSIKFKAVVTQKEHLGFVDRAIKYQQSKNI